MARTGVARRALRAPSVRPGGSVELHLAEYLDRPLVDLTADAITRVMERIEAETVRRGGSNPDNPQGRAAADRIIANVSAIWRSYDRRYGLPVVNRATRLQPATGGA